MIPLFFNRADPRCPSCRIGISKAMVTNLICFMVCVEYSASQCVSYFITTLKVFEDHAARRFIKKMDVNCCNEGCNWVGNLGSLLEVMMHLLKGVENFVCNLDNQVT